MDGNGMRRERAIASALALFLVFILLLVPAPSCARPQPDEGSRASEDMSSMEMPLYLMGGSALSPSPPDSGTEETASFRPGVGVQGVDVGVWQSRPLTMDLSISGPVKVVLWASGSGLQQSTFFGCYLGVDDQQAAEGIHTAESALSTTPSEFKGEGTTDLNASAGQVITVTVRVHERGTGGEVVFGSTAFPSRIILTAVPVSTSTYAEEHKSGRSITVRTYIEDAWGAEDIESVDQFIAGPYETRNLDLDPFSITEDKIIARAQPSDQMATDSTESGMNMSWVWVYEGMKSSGKTVEPGIYYLVGIVHCKGEGRVYADAGTVVLSEPEPWLKGATGSVLIAVIIGALAAVVYFYAIRTDRIKTDKGRALAAIVLVSVIVVAGMYAVLTVVPSTATGGGETAPDFKVIDIDGKTFKMSDTRGKVVLIDLMATWCPGCNGEMPTLVKLQQRFKGAVFVSISVEGSGDTDEQIKAFKAKYGADWTFARDTDKVWQRYQDITQPFIPTIVIINPQGKLSYREIGEIPLDELTEQMEKASKGGFDIGITTQGANLLVVAFIMGVMAFFSPCAFPLLPGYMGYVLSRREESDPTKPARIPVWRSIKGGLLAALGGLVLFMAAGLLVATAGSLIASYVTYLTPVIAIIIALMGVLMLLEKANWIERMNAAMSSATSKVTMNIGAASRTAPGGQGGGLGLFLYGIGYGIASMGCFAPVFFGLLMAGFAAGGFTSALLVFTLFGIGMGAMMVLVTVLVGMAKGIVIKRLTTAMPLIKRLSGLVMLVAGIYLAWYSLSAISSATG